MNAPETQFPKVRLTQFSHGGGCGCKIAPAVLSEILAAAPIRGLPKDLLGGPAPPADPPPGRVPPQPPRGGRGGVRAGRLAGRGRPFDGRAGADLWPGRPRV